MVGLNVLVAGGAGFIGSNLCAQLLQDEYRVVAVDNLSTGRVRNIEPLLANPRFEFRRVDIVAPLPDLGLFDRIYNLASPASPPGYQRFPIETLRVNSEGSRHLLELANAQGARYLYASTSEAYGDPLEHPQVETYRGNVSSTGPRSMYDEAKRFGEALAMAYLRDRGVDVRVVRIFNTYGPNSDPADGRLIPNFITQALRQEPLTVYSDGQQTRSLCYVSDLVAGLTAVMESDVAGGEVINLGNPEEHTILEFAQMVSDLAGSDRPVSYGPPAVGDDPQRRRPDIAKATALVGWTPKVPLSDGLARTIEYFRKELDVAFVHSAAEVVH